MNPLPSVAIIFDMTEQAAITEGSSIAIGTKYDLLLTLTLRPSPNGMDRTPMQFSIMWSASSRVSPPYDMSFMSREGKSFLS